MTNHEYVQEDESFTVSAERQQHFAIAYTKLSPWPVGAELQASTYPHIA